MEQSLMLNQNHFLDALYKKKNEVLSLVLSDFTNLEIFPAIGLEIEFYLIKDNSKIDKNDVLIDQFISNFINKANQSKTLISKIEKEQGHGQLEVKTTPSSQILIICQNPLIIKEISKEVAADLNIMADFSAQPFLDDCGSALQINLSFVDENNNNLFAKNDNQESDLLLNSIGGILDLIDQIMIFSTPGEKDYQRYNAELNFELFKNQKYTAPINVSWGYDNRTAAIRIPRSEKKEDRRLEFRIPAANADIYLVMASLLLAVKYGIDNKIKPMEPLYGNAFDKNYNLNPLIANYALAKESFFKPNPILNELKELLIKVGN